ncbi:MAG: hypothetical protein ABEI98_11710 [Halorhabdus sp.]|jgi:hypothetical protein
MAQQDSPGQQVHRALSTLRNIDTDELPRADTRRIEVATMLLSDVSIRAEVEASDTSEASAEPVPRNSPAN